MILVLFGQPGSGKTTMAKELIRTKVLPDAVNVDGDEIRKMFSNSDYSKEGRIKNLNRASDIATFLSKSGKDVILSLVYPYLEARSYLNALNDDIKWVYLGYQGERGRENYHVPDFDYPSPEKESFLEIDTTNQTLEQTASEISRYLFPFKILAKSVGQTSTSDDQYSMFIGRWQPWHSGHRWLIDQRLNLGKKVLICIRDVEPDEKNPFTAQEVEANIKKELWKLVGEEKVKIMIIPDIESVNIGRGIGYDVIEHLPPPKIEDISATKIREKLRSEGKLD